MNLFLNDKFFIITFVIYIYIYKSFFFSKLEKKLIIILIKIINLYF